MKLIPLLLLAALCTTGCATPYQNSGLTGGFDETVLGDNVFQVSFKGNAFISASKVADYALLRSAEVALENGYHYFVIVDEDSYSASGTISAPTTTYAASYGKSATFNTYGGQVSSYSKASSVNTIVCFVEKPDGIAFDARQVAESLRGKYGVRGGQ